MSAEPFISLDLDIGQGQTARLWLFTDGSYNFAILPILGDYTPTAYAKWPGGCPSYLRGAAPIVAAAFAAFAATPSTATGEHNE